MNSGQPILPVFLPALSRPSRPQATACSRGLTTCYRNPQRMTVNMRAQHGRLSSVPKNTPRQNRWATQKGSETQESSA